MKQTVIKRWNIQNLLKDENLRRATKDGWKVFKSGHNCSILFRSKEDLDTEVKLFKKSATKLLNNHAKVKSVSAYSKRWENKKVAEAKSS